MRAGSSEADTLQEFRDGVLREEQRLLDRLEVCLGELRSGDVCEVSEEDLQVLGDAGAQLRHPFLITVVGEFNSGKSTFINALLGERYLKEGVTPTTDEINIITWGEQVSSRRREQDVEVLHVPVAWLQGVSIVDTPGTNAVIRRHEAITEHFVPRSDLVLFLVSVDKALSQSERVFLESIRQWGKKVVLVVNKTDILEEEQRLEAVLSFVRESMVDLLQAKPTTFAVSARRALEAGSDAGFHELERFLETTIGSPERVALKLRNGLGVARHLSGKYAAAVSATQEDLAFDREALADLEEMMAEHAREMGLTVPAHEARVANILFAVAERSDRFLEEWVRPSQFLSMMFSTSRFRDAFDAQVLQQAPKDIDAQVARFARWTQQQTRAFLEAADRHLARSEPSHLATSTLFRGAPSRRPKLDDGAAGARGTSAHALVQEVGGLLDARLQASQGASPGARMASDVRGAYLRMVGLQAAALGAGFAGTLLTDALVLPWVGTVAAAAAAVAVVPIRRRSIRRMFRSAIDNAQADIALRMHAHLDASRVHLEGVVDKRAKPYRSWVADREDQIAGVVRTLERVGASCDRIDRAIDDRLPSPKARDA